MQLLYHRGYDPEKVNSGEDYLHQMNALVFEKIQHMLIGFQVIRNAVNKGVENESAEKGKADIELIVNGNRKHDGKRPTQAVHDETR